MLENLYQERQYIYGGLEEYQLLFFLYCCTLSMRYTTNQKKYLFRLYISSVIMGVVDYLLISGLGYYYITNNIFRTIFTMAVIIYIMNQMQDKRKYGMRLLLFYVLYQIVICLILNPNGPLGRYVGVELIVAPILGGIINVEGGDICYTGNFVVLQFGLKKTTFHCIYAMLLNRIFFNSYRYNNQSAISNRFFWISSYV